MGAFMFIPAMLIFLVFVAPIWIIAHYATRWRTSKVLSPEDEKMLSELWDLAPKLESRINTLESILDAQSPNWRNQT